MVPLICPLFSVNFIYFCYQNLSIKLNYNWQEKEEKQGKEKT